MQGLQQFIAFAATARHGGFAAAAREQWRGQEASLVLRSCREQFAEKRVPRNAEDECDMWSGALVDLRNSPASTAETLARRSDRAPA